MGDATSSLQYQVKIEKPASLILQLLEMRMCRKKQHEPKNKFYSFFRLTAKLQTLILNADYSRKYLSVAFENKTLSDDVKSLTIITLTCWASGNLNRSECCTFGDYATAQHGCNQGVRAAQSSQTPQISTHSCLGSSHRTICVCGLLNVLDPDLSWWQRTFVLAWTLMWWTV